MHPILFSLGKIHFYSFGFFASLAFIAGFLIIQYSFKKLGKKTENLIDKLLVVFLIAILTARVSYFVIYYNQFDYWWEIFYFWRGGMISYGGLIGGLIAYAGIFRKNLRANLDILAIAFLLGLFFWRIGCTLAGDHPTLNSNAWFAINQYIPVTLFESISGLIGFFIAWIIVSKKILKNGYLFNLVIIYYGLIRFIIDRWRIDPMLGNFSTGQISGIIMIVLGTIAISSLLLYDKGKLSIRRKKYE